MPGPTTSSSSPNPHPPANLSGALPENDDPAAARPTPAELDTPEWILPLRYEAKRRISWLAPREILRSAYHAYLASIFSAFADNRESQASLRPAVAHHRLGPGAPVAEFVNDPLAWHRPAPERTSSGDDEISIGYERLWIDYVADLGDGFSATYTIAHHLAKAVDIPSDEIGPEGDSAASVLKLPPSDMIVMGGDEVYPTASPDNYRHRTVGPYRTALGASHRPKVPLFAIPGNHDWYDGLASFLDRFTAYVPGGDRPTYRGWRSHQTRSYFAVQLTDRWWLWGIDIALDAEIDAPQMEYFKKAAAMLPDGSRLVLCTAKPSWLERTPPSAFKRALNSVSAAFGPKPSADDGWDRLNYFVTRTVGSENAHGEHRDLKVRLVLSGDKHFYARHTAEDPDAPTLVVAGGGGAYLSSTREAPRAVDVASDFGGDNDVTYTAEKLWPSQRRSAALGFTAMWRFPLRNPRLATLLGGVYTLFAWAAIAGTGLDRTAAVERMAGGPFDWRSLLDVVTFSGNRLAGLALWPVMMLAWVGLAGAHGAPKITVAVASSAHLILHAIGIGLTGRLAAQVAVDSGGSDALVYLIVAFAAGSAAGLFMLTLYLLVAQLWRLNLNELFAGIAHEGYKHFVRFKVSDDDIEGFVVGFAHVPSWNLTWVDGRPVVTTRTPPEPELVDRFTVEA